MIRRSAALATAVVLCAGAGTIPGTEVVGIVTAAMQRAGVGVPAMPPPARPMPACDHVPQVSPFQGRWSAVELRCTAPEPWLRVLRTGAVGGTGAAVSQPVAAALSETRPALSATRPLRRGERIAAGDLVVAPFVRLDAAQALTDPTRAIGRRLRAAVGTGQPVLERHLDPLLAVETGQRVDVVLQSGPIAVAAVAVALEGGKVGDVVVVQVLPDGRRIEAEIAGPRNLIVRPKIR